MRRIVSTSVGRWARMPTLDEEKVSSSATDLAMPSFLAVSFTHIARASRAPNLLGHQSVAERCIRTDWWVGKDNAGRGGPVRWGVERYQLRTVIAPGSVQAVSPRILDFHSRPAFARLGLPHLGEADGKEVA